MPVLIYLPRKNEKLSYVAWAEKKVTQIFKPRQNRGRTGDPADLPNAPTTHALSNENGKSKWNGTKD